MLRWKMLPGRRRHVWLDWGHLWDILGQEEGSSCPVACIGLMVKREVCGSNREWEIRGPKCTCLWEPCRWYPVSASPVGITGWGPRRTRESSHYSAGNHYCCAERGKATCSRMWNLEQTAWVQILAPLQVALFLDALSSSSVKPE